MLGVALAAALAAAGATTGPAVGALPASPAGDAPDSGAASTMLTALQRDLHLTADAASVRLTAELAAARLQRSLRPRLGAGFGGAWFSPTDNKLVVATTDPDDVPAIEAAGARPTLVARDHAELATAKTRLDRVPPRSPKISAWYVDEELNTVVVMAAPDATGLATNFVARAGLTPADVTILPARELPQLHHDVRGGDAYTTRTSAGTFGCSIGFAVEGGFVTAGHCGGAGSTVNGFNGVSQGVVRGSSFPGNDYAWVAVNDNWSPRPWVSRYDGSNVAVSGAEAAAKGSSVCRSGARTGWHCGTIKSTNVTVNYDSGDVVKGLTMTDACSRKGDSGGSFVSGSQAQGVLSGGYDTCDSPTVSFFQPVNEILTKYSLKLLTMTPPNVVLDCESGENRFLCTATLTGESPDQIHWSVNGSRVAAWDGRKTVTRDCTSTTTVTVAIVTRFGTDQSGPWRGCRSGPWL